MPICQSNVFFNSLILRFNFCGSNQGTPDCNIDSGYFNYVEALYCEFSGEMEWVGYVIYVGQKFHFLFHFLFIDFCFN